MNERVFAAKYAALEATFGFRPAVAREFIARHSGVEAAFDAAKSTPSTGELLGTYFNSLVDRFSKWDSSYFFLIRERGDFPKQLDVWQNATEVLYGRGDKSLLDMKAVAVVGSRAATVEGRLRADRIAKTLSEHSFCITSGLALGIDTAAHTGALRVRGKTLAVIGTPIDQYYPKENADLQNLIAEHGAVVSQFSPIRPTQRLNFPQRNELMSAFSLATIIVEASETSGALTQAKFCLKQGRKLLIMQNQIEKPELKWPREFLKIGAMPLKAAEDVLSSVSDLKPHNDHRSQLKFL